MINLDVINVSKMLSDEYIMKILAGSFKVPKSARDLSIKYDIPLAACYRKIHDLEQLGLLECIDKILTQEGRRVKMYRSQLKGAYLFYENGKLKIHMDITNFRKTDFDATWDVLNMAQSF
jgi:hypothetical protein